APVHEEQGHHAAVEVAPGRLAMQAEPGTARPAVAGIDIVQAQAIPALVVEGRARPDMHAYETVIGRAQALAQWCILPANDGFSQIARAQGRARRAAGC